MLCSGALLPSIYLRDGHNPRIGTPILNQPVSRDDISELEHCPMIAGLSEENCSGAGPEVWRCFSYDWILF